MFGITRYNRIKYKFGQPQLIPVALLEESIPTLSLGMEKFWRAS